VIALALFSGETRLKKRFAHIQIKRRSLGDRFLKKISQVGRVSFSKMLPESSMTVVGKLLFARHILKLCQRLAGFETC